MVAKPDKMASKTIIIIIIFHIYRCTCTFSFVVTEAEVATAAVLFDEASWAANMESGSRPSNVSALTWIKLSGSAENDALDALGDAAFNFLSGLSILCKKKGNIWIKLTFVAHIQSLHKSFFVVFTFETLKKEVTWSVRPAKQISQLGFCQRKKPNFTIKYNLAIMNEESKLYCDPKKWKLYKEKRNTAKKISFEETSNPGEFWRLTN